MKVTAQKAIELLAELGVDAVLVEEDSQVDINIDDVTAQAVKYLQPQIEPALRERIEGEIGAKNNGTLLSAIQSVWGIPKKEIDGKNYKEIVSYMKERSDNSTDKDEWKKKYEEAVRDYEEQIEAANNTWQSKYDTDIAGERKKYIDRDINTAFISLVEKMPRKGGDIAEQADALRYKVEKNGYELKYENGTLEFWKDNKKIKHEEVINPIAEKLFPIATDTRHVNPLDVKAGRDTGVDAGVKQVEAVKNYDTGIFGQV